MQRVLTTLAAAVCAGGLFAGTAAAGTRILFVASNETANATFELYSMNADGSGRIRITHNGESEWSPALAPDGYRIAYVRPSTGGSNLFVTTLHGTAPVALPNGGAALAVQWADDDTLYYLRRMAAQTFTREFQLWRIDVDGTDEARVYGNQFKCWNIGTEDFFVDRARQRVYLSSFMSTSESLSFIRSGPLSGSGTDAEFATGATMLDHYAPALSPDGTRMAYAADVTGSAGSHRIYNAPAAGGVGTALSTTYAGNPAWAPSGAWLAYTRTTASTFGAASYVGNIWRVNANGTGATNLTSGSAVGGGCAFPIVYDEGAPRITRLTGTGAMEWTDGLTRPVAWMQRAPAANGAWGPGHFAAGTNGATVATEGRAGFYRLQSRASEAVGHYPLAGNANDALGLLGPITLANAPFAGGGVYCNGVHPSGSPTGSTVNARSLPSLNLTNFVISVEFKPAGSYTQARPVFVCGESYRWAGIYIGADGRVGLLANNFAVLEWSGLTCAPDVWHEATLVYRGASQMLEAYLDGRFVAARQVVLEHGNNRTWGVTNYGNSDTFRGYVRNVRLATLR